MIPELPREFSRPVKIGSGGFGEVYRVRQMPLDRKVAVKVIYEKDKNKRTFLLKEAKTQANLHISCIPQVYNAFEYKGQVCIVMQWIRGVSLKRLLARGDIPPEKRRFLTKEVVYTVALLHSRGYAHRDIKPDNIIVAPDEGMFLIDFSFTKHVVDGEVSMAGVVKGTPAYMAPEIWSGNPGVDYMRADVYSTGRILQEIAGGCNNCFDSLIMECTRTSSKWRPENCVKLKEQAEGLDNDVYDRNARLKEVASAPTSDLLSKQLFSAGRKLLDAGRDDEAYWLLTECVEENPDFNLAVDLIDSFPQRSARRRLNKNLNLSAAAVLVVLIAGAVFYFNYIKPGGNVYKPGTRNNSMFNKSDKMVSGRIAADKRHKAVPFMYDPVKHEYLKGTVTLVNMPGEGTLFIDDKKYPYIDSVNKKIELTPETHRFILLDNNGKVIWKERVFLLPFERKRINVWLLG